jgi:hypothetical protein
MEKPNNMKTELADKIIAELFVNGVITKEELEEVHGIILSALTNYK